MKILKLKEFINESKSYKYEFGLTNSYQKYTQNYTILHKSTS